MYRILCRGSPPWPGPQRKLEWMGYMDALDALDTLGPPSLPSLSRWMADGRKGDSVASDRQVPAGTGKGMCLNQADPRALQCWVGHWLVTGYGTPTVLCTSRCQCAMRARCQGVAHGPAGRLVGINGDDPKAPLLDHEES